MTKPSYDHEFWENLWSKTLREQAAKVKSRPPSAYLTTAAQKLQSGRALDAGSGHGAESLWLAAHGWQVTAVDFSTAAMSHLRTMAEAAELTARIELMVADLATFTPEPGGYDLVLSLYVHVAGSVEAMVQRLASGVAPEGTLLLVGHSSLDPASGAPTAAVGQNQVSLQAAKSALDPRHWSLALAEERPRSHGGGVDAVICAQRLS